MAFNTTEERKDREQILNLVKEYYEKHHREEPDFTPGDRIRYAGRVYDEREMMNLVDASLEFWLTAGRYTDEFEKKFGEYLGIKYVSLVNSGSSANLLAFMALTSPLLGERRVKPGDEVITVACGFPTTVTPIIQAGAVPVFCDVTVGQYNIDITQLEEAFSSRTRAVMLAHTLGNPFDLRAVKAFCDRHGLWLIEDNCDALGSRIAMHPSENSAKNTDFSEANDANAASPENSGTMSFTGTIGDIATSSFYPPHHMTMGEGGAVYTADPVLHKIIRSLRDWGRDCMCPPGKDNFCGHRFDGQYGELPAGYDHKYVYSHFGYNLKATDLQAAVGCAQIDKFPDFVRKRKENWTFLRRQLSDTADRLILPEALPDSDPSWFGFLVSCREGVNCAQLVRTVEAKGIQTRRLFAGNLIKHPCFDEMRESGKGFRVIGNLENTDFIMQNSFWVGVYPGMTEEKLQFMADTIKTGIL